MEELKNYVDQLFSRYPDTKEIMELKAEILSNLAARKSDLLSRGMNEAEAVRQTKASITEIDGLIDGNIRVYKNRMLLGLLQKILFYTGAVFLITVPFNLFNRIYPVQKLLFWTLLLAVLIYLWAGVKRSGAWAGKTFYLNQESMKKWFRKSLLFTGILILLWWLRITGIYFIAPLMNGRLPGIQGPYALFSLLVEYIMPLALLTIPAVFHTLPGLALRYEATGPAESEKSDVSALPQSRRANLYLVLLLAAGLLLFVSVNAYTAKKAKNAEAERAKYLKQQTRIETASLAFILPYKNAYMGNASNTGALFYHLLLSEFADGFQMDPENRIATFRYRTSYLDADSRARTELFQPLCYNAAAFFALIGNLEGVRFQFDDIALESTREKTEEAFGPVESYLTESQWEAKVKEVLLDQKSLSSIKEILFEKPDQ